MFFVLASSITLFSLAIYSALPLYGDNDGAAVQGSDAEQAAAFNQNGMISICGGMLLITDLPD
jgi:hypothetical protein